MFKDQKIGFIGGGNIAEAIISGATHSKELNFKEIFVYDPSIDRQDILKNKYDVTLLNNNVDIIKKSDVVILAIKPQIIEKIITEIKDHLNKDVLIISVLAGIPTKKINILAGKDLRIIRVMPNTPVLVKEGMTVIAKSETTDDKDIKKVEKIFEVVGKTEVLEEDLMDAVTGLSGSGPAYFCIIIDAFADAGVKVGIPRKISEKLAIQTVLGSAKLLQETKEHPGRMKDMVTSPGGTAITGLHVLESGKVRATLIDAVEAATKRSRDLGEGKKYA